MTAPKRRITRLTLADFRNVHAASIETEARLVALVGDNGAGKTNVLEAMSLFAPGRGLRRVEFAEMRRRGASGAFAVSARLESPLGAVQLGVGYDPAGGGARQCRIDREPVASAAAFAGHCRLLWLTPDNDGLFRGPAGDRRRYLDRLVLAVNPDHGGRVGELERALRSRNRLLAEDRPDPSWLDAVEREVAAAGVAVAAARRETVSRLAQLACVRDDLFPEADLRLVGDLESALDDGPALAVEEWYRAALRENRWRDKAAGRALVGPNAADLEVVHRSRGMPAALCSTGEQKALLIGLMLAQARLVRQMSGMAPILLLDEIAAHLDPARRAALFALLDGLDGQVWMTGTDPILFESMPAGSARFVLRQGGVEPL